MLSFCVSDDLPATLRQRIAKSYQFVPIILDFQPDSRNNRLLELFHGSLSREDLIGFQSE